MIRFYRACVIALLLGSAAALSACASEPSRPAPAVTLASGAGAQVTYRTLRAQFFDAGAEGRAALIPRLRDFLEHHGDDDRADSVRVLLAFASLEQGELEAARAALAPVLAGPNGATRDFARVASAAALAREHRASEALVELERLDGRIVDLDERFLYGEERTRAAFKAGEQRRALRSLLAWLSQAPPDRVERVRESGRQLLGLASARELAAALAEISRAPGSTSPELETARIWLISTIAERLTRLALARVDPELARRVLEAAPASFRATDDGRRLVALSATAVNAPSVAGRALGLVLSVGDSVERRRAAAVAAGVMRALGSTHGTGREGVELVTRSGQGALDVELAALAGEGAALLVAGVSDAAARDAAEFAEQKQIPVLLLRSPGRPVPKGGFSFVLGENDAAIERVLRDALSAENPRTLARVTPGACGGEADSPGKPRFPLGEWRANGVGALLLLAGDAACALELARVLNAARLPLLLGLGLDAAEAYDRLGVPALAPRAGRFPERAPAGGWYEALGHDAALLAVQALRALPSAGLARGESVEALHERTRDALAIAKAELWTSDAPGFAGGRVLERELGVLNGGTKPAR